MSIRANTQVDLEVCVYDTGRTSMVQAVCAMCMACRVYSCDTASLIRAHGVRRMLAPTCVLCATCVYATPGAQQRTCCAHNSNYRAPAVYMHSTAQPLNHTMRTQALNHSTTQPPNHSRVQPIKCSSNRSISTDTPQNNTRPQHSHMWKWGRKHRLGNWFGARGNSASGT